MKKFVLPAIVLSFFLMSFTSGWFHYVDALTGFSVDMPGQPKVTRGSHPITHAPVSTAVYKMGPNKVFTAIGVKNKNTVRDIDHVLNDEIDLYCKSHALPKPAYPPVAHAKGYDYKVVRINNGSLFVNLKVCVSGNKVYTLAVDNKGAYAPGKEVATFFTSFRP